MLKDLTPNTSYQYYIIVDLQNREFRSNTIEFKTLSLPVAFKPIKNVSHTYTLYWTGPNTGSLYKVEIENNDLGVSFTSPSIQDTFYVEIIFSWWKLFL